MPFPYHNGPIAGRRNNGTPTSPRKNKRSSACLRVERLEDRLLLSVANNQTVLRLFDDLLERPAEASGLQFWTGLLAHGSAPGEVALGILDSVESHTTDISKFYFDFLGRAPDAPGLAGFVNFVQSGGRLDQVESGILGSPEFLQRAGGTQDRFLATLFLDVLGRQIDPVGQAAFTNMLNQGRTRADVAALVVNSTESQRRFVQQSYVRYLDRPADDAGLQGWTDALNHGLRQEQFLAEVTGSPEYLSRFVANPAPPIANRPALVVPGQGSQTVKTTFTVTGVETGLPMNWHFPVDDASGQFAAHNPDAGYTMAALAAPAARGVQRGLTRPISLLNHLALH